MWLDVTILDHANNPLAGETLRIRQNSGFQNGRSDRDGKVSIRISEPVIEQIFVSDDQVFDLRPLRGGLDVQDGIIMEIKMLKRK